MHALVVNWRAIVQRQQCVYKYSMIIDVIQQNKVYFVIRILSYVYPINSMFSTGITSYCMFELKAHGLFTIV